MSAPPVIELPLGFGCHVANVGIKDHTHDFVVVAADRVCAADGVFTTSRFAGPSVTLSREHLADGAARAIVVVSKNANVANGTPGLADARELVESVAARLGCAPTEVLVAQTEQGRGILGVVDGYSPKGVEDEKGIAWRKDFLRMIGYKVK